MSAHIPQRLQFNCADGGPASRGLWKRIWQFLSGRAAGLGPSRFSIQLGAGQELRLHDAAGWTVACSSGNVWITQEADTRDVFLNAGDSFTLDRAGLALILARQNSALAIRPPASGRELQAAALRLDSGTASAADSAREVWLRAVYPECGPWNDPAAFRRSGLL